MAGPITWRSLQSDSSRGVGQLLRGAQQSFNTGLGALDNLIQRHQQMEQQNWQNQKKVNTEDYLNAVQAIKDPDQLNQMIQDGTLDKQRAQYGYQIDGNVARQAAEQRASDLIQQATQKATFDDMNAKRDARPILEQAETLAAQGDIKGARAVLAQHPDVYGRGDAEKEITSSLFGWNGEHRAEAGEARAEQSQRMAQERQGWARENQAYTVGERNKEAALNKAAIQIAQEADAQEAKRQEQIQRAAYDQDIPLNANGVPDLAQASQPQIDAFNKRMKDEHLDQPVSTTKVANNIYRNLRDSGMTFSPQQLASARKNGMALHSAEYELSPEEQRDQDNALAYQDGLSKARLAKLDAEHKADQVNHSFSALNNNYDPDKATSEILASSLKSHKDWDPAGRNNLAESELRDALYGTLTNGADLPDPTAPGGKIRIKIPQGIAQQAVDMTMDSSYLSTVGDIGKLYENNLMKVLNKAGTEQRYKDDSAADAKYINDRSEESLRLLTAQQATRNKYKSAANIPPRSQDILDALKAYNSKGTK